MASGAGCPTPASGHQGDAAVPNWSAKGLGAQAGRSGRIEYVKARRPRGGRPPDAEGVDEEVQETEVGVDVQLLRATEVGKAAAQDEVPTPA